MNAINTVAYVTGVATGVVTGWGTLELLDDLENHIPYYTYTGKMKKHKERARIYKEVAKFNIAATTGVLCSGTTYIVAGTLLNVAKNIIKK